MKTVLLKSATLVHLASASLLLPSKRNKVPDVSDNKISFTTRIKPCLAYNPLLSTKRVVKMITNIEREEEMRKSRRFRDSSNLQVSIYYTSLSSGLQRHFLYNKVCPSFRFLSEFCQFAEKSTSLLPMYHF